MALRTPLKPAWLALTAALALAGCAGLPAPPAQHAAGTPLAVKILAINDFHGNLLPPAAGIRIRDGQDPARQQTVKAGGSEHMATVVKQLRSGRANTIFVGAGDLVSAKPRVLSGNRVGEGARRSSSRAISRVSHHKSAPSCSTGMRR